MSETGAVIRRLLDFISSVAAGAPGLAIPVSGGSDGALVLWLCKEALPNQTRALHFGNRLRARAWFERTAMVEYLDLPAVACDAEAFRWALTASYCLHHNCWPVGSRNRTEDLLRTYSRPSLYATVLPIVGLWKSEVMSLCHYIGVPDEVLQSSRRADPECGRPIELADIGIERIDQFLKVHAGLADPDSLHSLTGDELRYLQGLIDLNRFKIALPHRGPSLDGMS